MINQLAQELRMFASASELKAKAILCQLLPDLQHQYIIDDEIVTFYSPSHLLILDIVSYHHDHPDAYWVTWKREQKLKSTGDRYIRLEEKDLTSESSLLETIQKQLFKSLKIKVCGMRNHENISAIAALQPDYLGFISYPKSKRDIGADFKIPDGLENIILTGVVVNENFEYIQKLVNTLGLKAIQLHGSESPTLCKELKSLNISIIKVFSVDDDFDFDSLVPYSDVADFFLFDTKGKEHGGNGVKFNWNILEKYKGEKPLILSGGIDLEDISDISKLNLLRLNLYALDVNSKFEIEPALKDVEKVKQLINSVRIT